MSRFKDVILVTGGAGYIGSHVVVELINAGFKVVIVDNLSNSHIKAIRRIESITGKKVDFYDYDLMNSEEIEKIFTNYDIQAVMHFAGLKSVAESEQFPTLYMSENVGTLMNILRIAGSNHQVKTLIFSSSATVYGKGQPPFYEDYIDGRPLNPYGASKWVCEHILETIAKDPKWSIGVMRYFNPVGAHESGLLGEDPADTPNNLMPIICEVIQGKRDKLKIFGNDYDTADGTCERDFIHVVDLAKAHVAALKNRLENKGIETWNVGTGYPISVLELVEAFESKGVHFLYEFADRRPGDVARSFASVKKIKSDLGWEAERDVYDMVMDTMRWTGLNPNGYKDGM